MTAPIATQAAVVNFDDLTCGIVNGDDISNPYAGLNWTYFKCLDGIEYLNNPSGFEPGAVSGNNVAYNDLGAQAEISVAADAPKFNIDSLYLTAAWYDDLVVTIEAWRDGTSVSSTQHTLSATTPQQITLNLNAVDRVRFTASGGSLHPGYEVDGGPTFALDDLDISYGAPPTGVTATPGNGQATLSFTPPADNHGIAITGYQASCTPQGGGTAVTANGGGSPLVVPGLTNGTVYDCTVTTLSAAGASTPSAPAAVTPMAPAAAPGAPTTLTATPGPAQASLSFNPPADNGGSPITGYQASCTPQGGGAAVTANGGDSPLVVPGLTNGTAYDCTVVAINAAGAGPASDTVIVTPQAAPAAAGVTAVPTLSEWGLLLLGAALGATALRRRVGRG